MDQQSLQTIELELAILIRRLTSISTNKKISSLDRSAYLLLHQIDRHGSAGVKALADEFHLDISTISRQAAGLEQKGYVDRLPDPTDGRAYSLTITSLGKQELNKYREGRLRRITELLHEWPEEDRVEFARLLTKFNRTFI